MELGSRKKIDYSKWEVTKFSPTLYNSTIYQSAGCGKTAISTLVGCDPFLLKNTNRKNPNEYKDSWMLRELRKRGVKVLKIKPLEVTNHLQSFENKINRHHVLLVSQIINKLESSWSIFFQDYLIHNFLISRWDRLELINRVPITIYIVWHKKWV